jgi:hypothetical protein
MLREAAAAKVIVDFTRFGLELPSDTLKWRQGVVMTLAQVEALKRKGTGS